MEKEQHLQYDMPDVPVCVPVYILCICSVILEKNMQ